MGKRKAPHFGHATFGYPVGLPEYTVATAPVAANYTGHLAYFSNGAAGAAIIAFSDGTSWLRCDTRLAIAAV